LRGNDPPPGREPRLPDPSLRRSRLPRSDPGRRLPERSARAVGDLADRAGGHPEVRRDPLVGVALERVADDHLALLRGQRRDRPDHAPHAVALLHHLVRARDAVERLGQRLQPCLGVPRDVERGVAGDAVEPRPEGHRRACVAGERRIGVDERLLQRAARGDAKVLRTRSSRGRVGDRMMRG
jgi:hypothetical protein